MCGPFIIPPFCFFTTPSSPRCSFLCLAGSWSVNASPLACSLTRLFPRLRHSRALSLSVCQKTCFGQNGKKQSCGARKENQNKIAVFVQQPHTRPIEAVWLQTSRTAAQNRPVHTIRCNRSLPLLSRLFGTHMREARSWDAEKKADGKFRGRSVSPKAKTRATHGQRRKTKPNVGRQSAPCVFVWS